MIAPKHTPGPWSIGNAGNRQSFWNVSGPDASCIGTVNGWSAVSADEKEAMANACLIATAPELLEALERLLSVVEQHDTPLSDPERIAARAAIAKAKGEA